MTDGRFMDGMTKAGIERGRKVLAGLAGNEPLGLSIKGRAAAHQKRGRLWPFLWLCI